jgi:hypothetical protein
VISSTQAGALTILRFGTISAEVASFLAVATSDIVHVARLVAFLGNVAFLATVTTTPWSALGAVTGEVSLYKIQ